MKILQILTFTFCCIYVLASNGLENYKDGDVIVGRGKIKHHNNSDYVECQDVELLSFQQWLADSKIPRSGKAEISNPRSGKHSEIGKQF